MEMFEIPQELRDLDRSTVATKNLIGRQRVEIKFLKEQTYMQNILVKEQSEIIKEQTKQLLYAGVLVLVFWGYSFFVVAWSM